MNNGSGYETRIHVIYGGVVQWTQLEHAKKRKSACISEGVIMSLESEYDNLMTNGKDNGETIFDYLDNKKRIQEKYGKHDPNYSWDLIGKVIY